MWHSLPFTSGSHTTDVMTTGRTDYWPTRGNPLSSEFEGDYAAGLVVGQASQGIGIFLLGIAQWGLERKLFQKVWPLMAIYESHRLTREAAQNIEASSPAYTAAESSTAFYWARAGDVGAGGSMPTVPADFGSDDPFGLKAWWEDL